MIKISEEHDSTRIVGAIVRIDKIRKHSNVGVVGRWKILGPTLKVLRKIITWFMPWHCRISSNRLNNNQANDKVKIELKFSHTTYLILKTIEWFFDCETLSFESSSHFRKSDIFRSWIYYGLYHICIQLIILYYTLNIFTYSKSLFLVHTDLLENLMSWENTNRDLQLGVKNFWRRFLLAAESIWLAYVLFDLVKQPIYSRSNLMCPSKSAPLTIIDFVGKRIPEHH